MKPARGALIALGLVGVGMLSFTGISLSKVASVIGAGADYDMDPAQVKAFVAKAANNQGWQEAKAISRSAEPKPGQVQVDYSASLLPWMSAHVRVDLWPVRSGTHVTILGHAVKVKELKAVLDRQLPELSAP